MPRNDLSPIPGVAVIIVPGTLVHDAYAGIAYKSLKDQIEARGYPVALLSIPRLGLRSPEKALEWLYQEVNRNYPDHKLILVGHSQGASHILGLAQKFGGRVLKVIQIAPPNHGTLLASLGRWIKAFPAIGAMSPHSTWLHNLRVIEKTVDELEEVDYLCLMTVFDVLVVPFSASILKEAENILLAPRLLHPLLKQLGFRRSKGVELVDGITDHLWIIWNGAVLRVIMARFEALEYDYRQRAAASSPR